MKKILQALLVVFTILVGLWVMLSPMFLEDKPAAIMKDGKIIGVMNCDDPQAKFENQCSSLFCEKTLYDKGLVPANSIAIQYRHEFKFSNAPEKYVHFVRYKTSSGDIFWNVL